MIRGFLFLSALLWSFSMFSQRLDVRIKPDSIRLGEPVVLLWSLSFPKDSFELLSRPVFVDTSQWVKPLFFWHVEKKVKDGMVEQSQFIVISAYDSGRFFVPLRGAILLKGKDTVWVNPDSIFLYSTYVPVDTTKPIKDIKELAKSLPQSSQKEKKFPWWWLAVVILLVLAGVALYFYFKKKRTASVEPTLLMSSWEKALLRLNEMKEKSLWLKMNPKEFYIMLTDVLRRYMEEEFYIEAEEMVTSQIIDALRSLSLSEPLIFGMQELFSTADMAKFAKGKPDPLQMEYHVHVAIDFVEKTHKKEEELANDVDHRSGV